MVTNTYVVALIGGIASGKSTAAGFFSKLNVPIIDADEIAKKLTLPGTEAYLKILDHFGDSLLNDKKMLNRVRLREIIFNNHSERKWLENLLHPLIRQEVADAVRKVKAPYCICVIPLLAEKGDYPFINRVLLLEASSKNQQIRGQARDASSIKKIINAQSTNKERRKMADDIIENNTDKKSLYAEIILLHKRYLEMSKLNR